MTERKKKWHNTVIARAFVLFNFISFFFFATFLLFAATVETIWVSCWLVQCGRCYITCHVLKRWFNTIFKSPVKTLCSPLQLAGGDKTYTRGHFGSPVFSMLLRWRKKPAIPLSSLSRPWLNYLKKMLKADQTLVKFKFARFNFQSEVSVTFAWTHNFVPWKNLSHIYRARCYRFCKSLSYKKDYGRESICFQQEVQGNLVFPQLLYTIIQICFHFDFFIEMKETNNTSNNNMSQSLALFHNSTLTKTSESLPKFPLPSSLPNAALLWAQ